MAPLHLSRFEVRTFRNLATADIEPSERFNIFSGENGQGKTNVLEAIYVAATSKSFRTSKLGELVQFRQSIASVRGTFVDGKEVRIQSIGLKGATRLARIDEKRPKSLAAYAVRSPIVVFHPGEMVLSMGGSGERRRLLDRISLYRSPQSLLDAGSYSRALKERQRALETRGTMAADLSTWEELVVRHGLALMEYRRIASALLAEKAIEAFGKIAAPGLVLSVSYEASAPSDAFEFTRALEGRRASDLRRGGAGIGPHRDELSLSIDGYAARGFASQGQHRALTLSLKSAEIEVVGASRGVRPILLLDDVSSELDKARTADFFSFLQAQSGQVFLTTTRPELIDSAQTLAVRRDFIVRGGIIERRS